MHSSKFCIVKKIECFQQLSTVLLLYAIFAVIFLFFYTNNMAYTVHLYMASIVYFPVDSENQ